MWIIASKTKTGPTNTVSLTTDKGGNLRQQIFVFWKMIQHAPYHWTFRRPYVIRLDFECGKYRPTANSLC